jgi:hypothetical protein
MINTLLLYIPLLALTHGQNYGRRKKLILVGLGNLRFLQVNAYLFLAINGCGTSSGGGGSGDGSSGARGVCAAVCSSGGMVCGIKQCALVESKAAADGGTIAMDGRQPACLWQRAADVVCVQQRAAERRVCNSAQQQQADGSSQQHDCNGR